MKKILLFILYSLSAQNSYNGQITFDYNGTVNGSFTSIVQDSLMTGIAFNQMGEDTSYFFMASITEQDDNEFDLFFAVLQDTTFPVQPRTWDIPGEGDAENPLSLEAIVVLMPGLDSSFVAELFDTITDTSNTADSVDILSDIFSSLTDDLYLGIQGELEITDVTDSSLAGNFNSIMLKPAFHFPPHMVTVTSGEFTFNEVAIPGLNTTNNDPYLSKSIALYPAYPNPFNPSTTIQFSVHQKTEDASLVLYDINGRKLETIFTGSVDPGLHKIQWHGAQNPSGIYFAVFQTENTIQSRKLILVK